MCTNFLSRFRIRIVNRILADATIEEEVIMSVINYVYCVLFIAPYS